MKQIINNNSSLFSNFIKNSIKAPSPKVQQNFMKVTSELVEVIKKILETEKLIFDVSYEGKKYWENAKKHIPKCPKISETSTTDSKKDFKKGPSCFSCAFQVRRWSVWLVVRFVFVVGVRGGFGPFPFCLCLLVVCGAAVGFCVVSVRHFGFVSSVVS